MAISIEFELRVSEEPSDLQLAAIESAEQPVMWWEQDISRIPLDDPVGIYFREIKQHPRLSLARERELTSRVQHARAARNEDKAAFDELVNSNLRLVAKIALKYNRGALPLLDLIQEGNIGLMLAINKFDPGRGFRLSTYATWWIRQGIIRANAKQKPVYISEKLAPYFNQYSIFQQELGRDPTDQEMADELQVPEKKMQGWLVAVQTPLSLDTPLREEEDDEEEGIIMASTIVGAWDTEEEALKNNLRDEIEEALQILIPRERQVLELYFGLGNQKGQGIPQEKVGERFGLTGERIRQIKARVLDKLRVDPGIRHLLVYLSD